jgi:2-polyprenyl-6-methoxyphenol hydroxylase-like FAD-dependent oxidoreductase
MARTQTTEVLIIGAGPVGLMTALTLSARGVQVQIVDKNWRTASHSYALALHPATLRLLEEHGLADDLVRQGRRIEKIVFHDGREPRAEVSLSALGGRFPFALVVTQSALESALEKCLRQQKIKVLWNHEVSDLGEPAGQPLAVVDRLEKVSSGYPIQRTEWVVAKTMKVRASYLVGADGYHSFVRTRLGMGMDVFGAPEQFEVFEFSADAPLASAVRVALVERSVNVLWPMPEDRCRWTFQTETPETHPGSLERLGRWIEQRAPWFTTPPRELRWSSSVQFDRRLAPRFGSGRCWLAGDAAHLTSPVGVQSMNVGLREAVDLAGRLATILRQGGSPDLLDQYQQERTQEWRQLLALSGEPVAKPPTNDWIAANRAAIPSCLPASGEDLRQLLGQLGLTLAIT